MLIKKIAGIDCFEVSSNPQCYISESGIRTRMMSAEAQHAELQDLAHKLRIHSVKMTTASNSGHPTSCSSMAEIMSVSVVLSDLILRVLTLSDLILSVLILYHSNHMKWIMSRSCSIV